MICTGVIPFLFESCMFTIGHFKTHKDPCGSTFRIFLELGAKLVLVSRFGKLVGMITKKAGPRMIHSKDHLFESKRGPNFESENPNNFCENIYRNCMKNGFNLQK